MKDRKKRVTLVISVAVFFAVIFVMGSNLSHAAEKITMRYAHGYPLANPAGMTGAAIDNYIKNSPVLKDRIKFEHYPGNSLYTTAEARNQVKAGGLEFSGEVSSYLSMNYPEFQLLDMPFLFKSPDHCYDTLNQTKQGKELLKKIETLGLTVITPYKSTSFFYKYWNNKRALRTPADFKGLKIRTAPGIAFTDVTKLLGASTITMAVPEVVSGFQTGMLDGVMTNENGYHVFRIMDYCKHVTLFDINSSYSWYVVNTEWWEKKVPAELKPELIKAIEAGARAYEKGSEELRIKVWNEVADLAKKGKFTVTILTDKEKQMWIDAEKPIYEKLGDKYGWEIIKKAQEIAPKYKETGADIIAKFK
ncbi:MAG: C4-dicarboxylate-binding periplasmic protein precursor [Smithella sp. PtaU1.Bin162]|nr:MAG: C4-dicarboxylate-binding periplasmic protein precursor [Smithella sp. PtaU1.Bin162]